MPRLGLEREVGILSVLLLGQETPRGRRRKNLHDKQNSPSGYYTGTGFAVNVNVRLLTLEEEKRTGESRRIEGLKLGGIERYEEGETGGGDRGKEEGGKDLYFGISMFLLTVSEFIPQLKRDFGRLMASSSSSSCLLGERRSVKEVVMN